VTRRTATAQSVAVSNVSVEFAACIADTEYAIDDS